VRGHVAKTFLQLLNDKDSSVRIGAVKAITRLEIKEAGPQLLALVKTDREPSIRVQALRGLVELQDKEVEAAVKSALTVNYGLGESRGAPYVVTVADQHVELTLEAKALRGSRPNWALRGA